MFLMDQNPKMDENCLLFGIKCMSFPSVQGGEGLVSDHAIEEGGLSVSSQPSVLTQVTQPSRIVIMQRPKSASPSSDATSTSSQKYKETFNFVAFHSKVNLRRKFRSKTSRFANFVDVEKDFNGRELEAYQGPHLAKNEGITGEKIEELQTFLVAKQGRLHRKFLYRILGLSEDWYRRANSLLVDVDLPSEAVINICGDIHGQLYDLIKILKLQGPPSSTNYYLFNGDIVDKGQHSIECLILLLAYKLAYPKWVFINRGNHESAMVNVRHGFQKELLRKYPQDIFLFEFIGELFKWIPVAHLISQKILVVHGGLPQDNNLTIDDIRQKKPPTEAQHDSTIAGLLWSDPVLKDGYLPSTRGMGVFFGPDVTKGFLERNDLKCLIRSHAEVKNGCGLSHAGCYTVFSAPLQEKGIMGGLIELRGDSLNLQGNVFSACGQEEAVALLEGRKMYPKSEESSKQTVEVKPVEETGLESGKNVTTAPTS